MSTINFPNISPPSYPFKEKIEDNSIRSKFEDGSMQSRKKFTRSRDTFTVTWNNLPGNEYRILKNFIKNTVNYSAESFVWTYPAFKGDVSTRRVRITDVQESQCNNLDYWTVTLELTEV